MQFIYDDGGRAAAGHSGKAGDCVCRAIAIATGLGYRRVYASLLEIGWAEGKMHKDPDGLYRPRHDNKFDRRDYLASLGWRWIPTMAIGRGCRVHLRDGELPLGRLIVQVSRHWTAVINNRIYDTFDPSRGGKRCVYGYFSVGQ
jgi:hypothetical protein